MPIATGVSLVLGSLRGQSLKIYIHLYIHTCMNINISTFLSSYLSIHLSIIYLKTHAFTPILSIPNKNHRVHSSIFLFNVYNYFSNSEIYGSYYLQYITFCSVLEYIESNFRVATPYLCENLTRFENLFTVLFKILSLRVCHQIQ